MTSAAGNGYYRLAAPHDCEHLSVHVEFDEEAAKGLSASEVRCRWPRFHGCCSDCGSSLIKYASYMHYLMGDW